MGCFTLVEYKLLFFPTRLKLTCKHKEQLFGLPYSSFLLTHFTMGATCKFLLHIDPWRHGTCMRELSFSIGNQAILPDPTSSAAQVSLLYTPLCYMLLRYNVIYVPNLF
eukprot:c17911_g1_i1 orf=111-437(-)